MKNVLNFFATVQFSHASRVREYGNLGKPYHIEGMEKEKFSFLRFSILFFFSFYSH